MSQSPVTGSGRAPTKVVMSLLTLVPGGMGGSETYARAMTRELGVRPDLDLSVLVPASARGLAGATREVVLPQIPGTTRRGLASVRPPGRRTPCSGGESRCVAQTSCTIR